MNLPENTLLQGGKYRIVRFISSGGFGCTYEAEHVRLEKRVAIKEFFVKDFCNRDETTSYITVGTQSKRGLVEKLRGKFIEEAKSLCKLQHAGIVGVSDVFEENGTAYFVMDYVEGRSLGDIVNQEGPLPEERAVRYILAVAEALQYVHDNNRLHLDIKPGNIMIGRNGNPVLIDFGASKQYDEVDGENTSTLLGKTPGYAPPEQMANNVVKFTPATDVYALGATLYKLLTGITPPDAFLRMSGEEMEPLPASISGTTRNAVSAAMEINKNKRTQSLAEFIKVLSPGHVEDDPTVLGAGDSVGSNAAPPSSPPRKFEFKKKQLVLCGAVVLSVISIIIGFVFIPPSSVPPTVLEDMVYVEGGTFSMGALPSDSDAYNDEKPSHSVKLSSYYIGKYEVTQKQWRAIMGGNPSTFKGDGLPVENVSWNDVQEFIRRLNAKTGKAYRLPTEAEWEYAARGGRYGGSSLYSGGDDIDAVAWHSGNSRSKTHPVGTKSPNALGIYDMTGNVYEWCSDWYDEKYYSKSPSLNPQGPSSGAARVLRGGSWRSFARICRVSNRYGSDPGSRYVNVGFRLVLSD